MNREIKFRGKRIDNNEWNYGCLINYLPNNNPRIISCEFLGEQNEPDYKENNNEIKAESVGQFTGLKDKNGIDIYEGDIVRFNSELFEVSFYIHSFVFCQNSGVVKVYNLPSPSMIEVIGNIHENSELL